jgi:hypothetical protein
MAGIATMRKTRRWIARWSELESRLPRTSTEPHRTSSHQCDSRPSRFTVSWLVAGISATLIPAAALLIADLTFSLWAATAYLLVVSANLLSVLVMYEITYRPFFRSISIT